MLGKKGEAETAFLPEEQTGAHRGKVRFEGALWEAKLSDGDSSSIEKGQEVTIVAVEGLVLTVKK